MPELFAPSSIGVVADQGLSVVEWRVYQRPDPPFPYVDLIVDYDPALTARRATDIPDSDLSRAVNQWSAEELVRTYLTRDEVRQLGIFLRDHHPAWFERFRAYPAPAPIAADEADGHYLPEPELDDPTARVVWLNTGTMVVEGEGTLPSLSLVGHVEPWPHGALEPHELVDLLSLADRLGTAPRGSSRET